MSQKCYIFSWLRNGNHDIHSVISIDRNKENANFPPIWNALGVPACKRIDDPNAINTMSIRFVFVWINPVENSNKAPYFQHKYTHPTWIRIAFFSSFLSLPEVKPKLAINCVRLCTQEHIERSIYTLLLSVDYQRVTATCSAFVEFFTYFSITFFFGVLLSVRYFPKNLLSIAMEAEALSHWMKKQVFISFFSQRMNYAFEYGSLLNSLLFSDIYELCWD